MPISDLLVLTKRQTISVAVISLDSADIGDIEMFAAQRPDLELAAIDEPAYYAGLAKFFRPVQILIAVSALIVALGAMLGGLNALDAAFASRSREIAMLQGDAAQAQAIHQALRAQFGPLKSPKALIWRDEFALLPSGKPDLARLGQDLP